MMTEDTRPLVQVVAGILLDQNGRYLLSSRPEGKPYAGYWEFAGGKVEAGESDFQALQRAFEEELGIRIRRAVPWLTKIRTPAIAISPNTNTIAPPKTGLGIVVNARPMTGNKPRNTKIAAIYLPTWREATPAL